MLRKKQIAYKFYRYFVTHSNLFNHENTDVTSVNSNTLQIADQKLVNMHVLNCHIKYKKRTKTFLMHHTHAYMILSRSKNEMI